MGRTFGIDGRKVALAHRLAVNPKLGMTLFLTGNARLVLNPDIGAHPTGRYLPNFGRDPVCQVENVMIVPLIRGDKLAVD